MTVSRFVLPDGPHVPAVVQGAVGLFFGSRYLHTVHDRYGSAFTIRMPVLGSAVVISDPDEVRAVFTNSDVFGNVDPSPLGRVIGPGSTFSLSGESHRRRRKLLVPPFNGRRLEVYRELIAEEARREMATWPEGREFPVMESMMRMTARIILRTVFGAEGQDLERLRELLPAVIERGSKLALMPVPEWELFGLAPWGRYRKVRRRADAILFDLIARAENDPGLAERDDILALMVRARDEDGGAMSDQDIADELSTLLAAGHETTATTLTWAVERLRRHPELLARLAREVDDGGGELRDATIWEVQRTRPVIEFVVRRTTVDGARLGRWILPKGQTVIASIGLMHANPGLYPDPDRFDPERFLGHRPDMHTWIPFGGGVRRCIGASFAHLEMNIVLRVLLTDFELAATAAPDEKWTSRGIASAPADRGLALVRRRAERADRPRRASSEPEPGAVASSGGQCPFSGAGTPASQSRVS